MDFELECEIKQIRLNVLFLITETVDMEVKKIDVRGFDVIYSALEAYKAFHGNLLLLWYLKMMSIIHLKHGE
jgi:hypothetical protein